STSFLLSPCAAPVPYPLSLHDALPICEFLHASLGAHLALDQRPVKHDSRAGIGDQLHGLAAAVIREEREPAAIQPAIEHDAHRRSEEHTSELQSLAYLVCRLLLEKQNT